MMAMSNEQVGEILKDAQRFWMKWRNNVPERDSDAWDEVVKDVQEIMERHGKIEHGKENDGRIEIKEEYLAAGIILWFLDNLEDRCKENEKVERRKVYV